MTSDLIEIIDYQARWPAEFAEVATRLRAGFGSLASAIHHIGSTSVAGLPAKDIVDVQVTVSSLDPIETLNAAIDAAGFRLRPDIVEDHVPVGGEPDPSRWRKCYAREPDGKRRTHVHIRVAGHPNQRYPLLFRDYLRATPSAAGSYALIKRELAARHGDDVDAYYAVKDPAMDLIMAAAELWAERSGWRLPPTDA